MRACWTVGERPHVLGPGPLQPRLIGRSVLQEVKSSDERSSPLSLPSGHSLFSVLFGLGGGYTHWALRESYICVADFRSGR